MPIRTDPDLHRFLVELTAQLRATRNVGKILRAGLRAAHEFFHADNGVVALARRGSARAEVAITIPPTAEWDLEMLDSFIRAQRPEIPPDQIVAPLRRRGMPWGALALHRATASFERGEGRLLARIAAEVSRALEDCDRDQLSEARARIDRKLMEKLRPKDLFYQILHALRSLTHYDHSSALFVSDGDETRLKLVAEQIAWSKGKSERIGLGVPLAAPVRSWLDGGQVSGFDRIDGAWRPWTDGDARVADLVSHMDREVTGEPEPAEGAMLCAPITTGDGFFGVLKIAALHPGTFGRYDADLLVRFVPQASIAIQNSRRTESLEARMLEAEKKHVMAGLARGVSHDVNNALGAILPLVQQIRSDLADGLVEPEVLRHDMDQIETSLQVCRRIFGGMLEFARGTDRRRGPADLKKAVENALAVLKDGMGRHGIEVELALAADLPPLDGSQGDLEQLFLNLLTNARDALPNGGHIHVRARRGPGGTEVLVEDDGIGIAEESLSRIQEPFFTTKPHGNGLGLSICRSIVWEMNGELQIRSAPGAGTRVRMHLPERTG